VEGSSARRGSSRGNGSDDAIVLCYHAVSEDWRAPLSVTPQQFEFQIQLLASRGYRGATFTEVALQERPEKVVAVTFDDGYRSVIDVARPILDRYGFPGTVFVPTRFMDTDEPLAWDGIDEWLGGPHENELLPMSWAQLRSLADQGWEIGSHTLTHPRLPAIDSTELRAELVESRQECARMIGSDCTSIAFPYGDADARVLREAEAAGYSAAAMLSDRLDRSSRFACPRIGVYQVDGRRAFRLKVSPTVRRLRRSRAWLPIAKLLHSVRRG
jgi:peptidoglycan/xylan/chitin deacetylase (PgdA/CDA1 family)